MNNSKQHKQRNRAMKKLIMIMTVVAGIAAFAECEAKQEVKTDVAQVESLAALKARKAAESCGCTVEAWNAMSKKEQKAARQKARAAKKGMTVEEMKAERTRKEAEKVGCPVEKWSAMSVKERIAFRKQAKAQ